MRLRTTTTAGKMTSAEKVSRRERKLAQTRALWIDLAARLQQSRTHGIPLEEAKKRLEEREAREKAQRARRRRRTAARRSR